MCGENQCVGPGHTVDASFPLYDINGKNYFRYPRHLVADTASRWADFYRHYKDGFLPASGGILDQTARFCQAMRVIENEMNSDK